jgi:hypothetical protein
VDRRGRAIQHSGGYGQDRRHSGVVPADLPGRAKIVAGLEQAALPRNLTANTASRRGDTHSVPPRLNAGDERLPEGVRALLLVRSGEVEMRPAKSFNPTDCVIAILPRAAPPASLCELAAAADAVVPTVSTRSEWGGACLR